MRFKEVSLNKTSWAFFIYSGIFLSLFSFVRKISGKSKCLFNYEIHKSAFDDYRLYDLFSVDNFRYRLVFKGDFLNFFVGRFF